MTTYTHAAAILLLATLPGFAMPALAQDATTAAPTEPAVSETRADPVAIATRFLDRFDAGEFEASRADFNDQMRDGLDAAQLEAVSRQLEGAGSRVGRDTARVTERDGYQVVVIPLRYTAAMVDATVSVDGDGRVAGVFFTPASDAGAD